MIMKLKVLSLNAGIQMESGKFRMCIITRVRLSNRCSEFFYVEPKEQFYKLDIFERTNENIPMKIKIMKSVYVKSVMDNFRQ